VNTFLPYPDFSKSAACLDRQRLGKQRVECLQLLRALLEGAGWRDHPAAKMWGGHEGSLATYAIAVCQEWQSRGYADTVEDSVLRLVSEHRLQLGEAPPPWLGDEAFHAAHRSNLLRKDPVHYRRFGWSESSDLQYIWPVR